MKNMKFALVCGQEGEVLREYETVEKVLDDIQWKDPSCFYIGEIETKQGYTFEDFIKKFGGNK